MKKRIFAAVLTAAALSAVASTASAAGNYGTKVFALGDQTFSATDSNGTFSAQVTYVSGGKPFVENPVAFGFFLSPALVAIATGTKTCTAYQTQNGVVVGTYGHSPVAPNYQWHWTFNTNPIGDNELASGQCVFPVEVGGNPGKATVTFTFHYVVGDGGGDVARLSETTQTTITEGAGGSAYGSALKVAS